MKDNDFLAFSRIVSDYFHDIGLAQTINLFQEIQYMVNGEPTQAEICENAARNSQAIRDLVANGQKIQAVKELRILTGCALREAKDAIAAVYGWN